MRTIQQKNEKFSSFYVQIDDEKIDFMDNESIVTAKGKGFEKALLHFFLLNGGQPEADLIKKIIKIQDSFKSERMREIDGIIYFPTKLEGTLSSSYIVFDELFFTHLITFGNINLEGHVIFESKRGLLKADDLKTLELNQNSIELEKQRKILACDNLKKYLTKFAVDIRLFYIFNKKIERYGQCLFIINQEDVLFLKEVLTLLSERHASFLEENFNMFNFAILHISSYYLDQYIKEKLAKNNNQLAKNNNQLANNNNQLANSNDQLAKKNNELSKDNLQLTNKMNFMLAHLRETNPDFVKEFEKKFSSADDQ